MLMRIYSLSFRSPTSARNGGGAGVEAGTAGSGGPGSGPGVSVRVSVSVSECECVRRGARLLRNVRRRPRACSRRHENEVREGRSTLQHKSRRKGEWM